MMRSFVVAAGVLLLVVSLGSACHRDATRAIANGRGGVRDTSAVQITAIAVASEFNDYDGSPVPAGSGSEYVLLDCHITAPPDQVDLTDFQLVQERASELGTEANLGNPDDTAYFYWSYLDESGRRLPEPPASAGPFPARLAFKVPVGVRTGYLFYWGLYWGPLTFPAVEP
jgi:hypothetical protein